MNKNICIIGSGSWGCALAIHLAKMGHNIKMWAYLQEEADLINNKKECKFLPNIILPNNIVCFTNFKDAIENSEIILLVTPSKVVRQTIKECKQYITNQPIIICSKGFEKDTLYTLNEVIEEELPDSKIGGLSRTKPCRRSIYWYSNCISYSIKIQ
jgi:glycerol-3-phosphate dehydrogenase (NAD(P)+)